MKIKKKLAKYMEKAKALVTMTSAFIVLNVNKVFATQIVETDVMSSKLVTGTVALLGDLNKAVMIIAPILSVLCLIYFALRMKVADEMGKQQWQKRMIGVCITYAIILSAGVILGFVSKYYKP